jgi:hypothetical protein
VKLAEYQEFIEAPYQLGTISVPGECFIETSTGEAVNVIDKQTFVIVGTKRKLRLVLQGQ